MFSPSVLEISLWVRTGASLLKSDKIFKPFSNEVEKYCLLEVIIQDNIYYYSKSNQQDYLARRYYNLYQDFMDKYYQCIEEYNHGNMNYQGYKKR